MIGKVLLRKRLHRNFTIAKQCLFAVQRGVINTNKVHNTVLQCDINLIKLEGVMRVREGRVRFDSEVGREAGPEDDSGDPHGRGAGVTRWHSHWEPGLVGGLCFIPMGVEPGLGQEHQVDFVVIHELRWKFHIVFVVSQLDGH